MSKLIKNTSKIILTISVIVLIIGLIINTLFGEKIEKTVIQQIKNQITSELHVSKINFSLFNYFPYASINLDDLIIIEKTGFNNDTLIYAKNTSVKLSAYDLLFKQVDIKKITLSKARINIKYDSLENANFSVLKTNKNPKYPLSIEKIMILETKIKYLKKNLTIDLDVKKGVLHPVKNQIRINANIFSKTFSVYEKDYIKNKNLYINTSISFKKDSVLINESSEINIEEVSIKCYGEIINKHNINISFSCASQKVKDIMNHTPEHLKSIYEDFDADGSLSCDGYVKGEINGQKNPELNIRYSIKEGVLKIKDSHFNLNNIDITGEITNGEKHNFMTTEIQASKFNAKSKNGEISGQFKLTNLNNYYLNTTFNSSWNLKEINRYFTLHNLTNLNGKLITKTKYSGNMSFSNQFPKIFLGGDHYSNTRLENVNFKYNNLDWSLKNIDCLVKNNTIEVYKSNLTIADSDLKFEGQIINLINNLITKKDSIIIQGDLYSTYIKLDELIGLNNSEDKEGNSNIYDWINIGLNSNIGNLSYNQFIASNVTGKLNYKNHTLTGKSISFNTLNGNVISDFKFYKSNSNKFKLFSQTDLNKLNIRNTFLVFNNFQQDFITSEHIKGQASAQIQMQASWDDNFNFIPEDLNLKSYLIIDKGELIRFKPLENLSNFVSIEDLKEVKFSTLENTIEIENNIVKIPSMEIKSSALSVFISGTHTFAQKIDYRIKLLLSEIISTKFRKKNTQIEETEFGEIQKESKIFNTIYFKMTGDAEDPYVSFDGLRFKEDIQKSIKQEKETITNIIKEDILQNKEKERKEKGKNITIEWDDKQ